MPVGEWEGGWGHVSFLCGPGELCYCLHDPLRNGNVSNSRKGACEQVPPQSFPLKGDARLTLQGLPLLSRAHCWADHPG